MVTWNFKILMTIFLWVNYNNHLFYYHSTIQHQPTPLVTYQGASISDTSLDTTQSKGIPFRSSLSNDRYQTPPPIDDTEGNRGVRFSEKITAISPEVSEEGRRGDRVSIHVVTEMFNQIQHNVLVCTEIYNIIYWNVLKYTT